MKQIFTCTLFVLLSLTCQSQNETKKWLSGLGVRLDFMTNPPTNLSVPAQSAMPSQASIADASGNLLFYVSNGTLRTSTHAIMANSSGLLNGYGLALIVKQPASSNLYYVFYTRLSSDTLDGLYYSVVNTALSAGQGSVTVKNVRLYSGSLCYKLTGTAHCNGISTWIVTKDLNNTNPYTWNGIYNFRSYELSAVGVNTVPTISTFTYAANTASLYANAVRAGQMKISPNGKKLACGNYGFSDPYNSNVGSFEIYDFNNSTGLVSNFVPLYTGPAVNVPAWPMNASGWGVEFSPDASKLYGTLSNNYYYAAGSVLQWDLCQAANSNTALAATQVSVATPSYNINGFMDLQLAADGKIYVNPYAMYTNALNTINFPNAQGTASGFSLSSQSTSPGLLNYNLPNFMGSQFFLVGSVPAFSLSSQATIAGCQTWQFQTPLLPGATIGNCPANSYTLQSLEWDFGDPSSGAASTSTLMNPSHTYSVLGNYLVQLHLNFGCDGKQTITQTVSVTNPVFGNLVASNNLSCNSVNTGTAFYANSQLVNAMYLWTNGAVNYTSSTVNTLGAGSWTAVVTSSNNCQLVNIFVIQQPPPLIIFVTPTANCLGGTIAASVSGGTGSLSLNWSNGAATMTTIAGPVGQGWATTTDVNNCAATFSFSVYGLPNVSTNITATTICQSQSITISATGAQNYIWSNNILMPSFVYNNPNVGTQVISVTGMDANNCSNTASLNIEVIACPTNTTGLFEMIGEEAPRIFPNPSGGSFSVEGVNSGEIQVYDQLGSLVQQIRLNGSTHLKLDNPGVYCLFIRSGRSVWHERVVIVR